MDNTQITVTSPLLPDLDELDTYLRDIWSRKWITNNGHYHKELEAALCEYLKVPFISLFTNGTLPLITALQALRITGEVITTPFSFVATPTRSGGTASSPSSWTLTRRTAASIPTASRRPSPPGLRPSCPCTATASRATPGGYRR